MSNARADPTLFPISLTRKQESLSKLSKGILLMTLKGQMGKIIQTTLLYVSSELSGSNRDCSGNSE